MVVMEPTPGAVTLESMHYESDDGQQFDGFHITGESTDGPRTGVVMLHGLRGTALSGGIAAIAYALARRGLECLAINKRNSGKLYETSDFSAIDHDIRGAIEWLQAAGCEEIVLWGRSLGATEAAYYQGKRNDPDVDSVVLAAPFADIRERSTMGYFEAVSETPEKAYEEFVETARERVADDRGNEIVALPRPVAGDVEYIPMTAQAFLSYRSPESDCATIDWTPSIAVPMLLVPHAEDRNVTPAEAEEIRESATNSPLVSISPIESDHFFSGHEDEVAEETAAFVSQARD
ncbi:alpha/beta hydrolase family protein [Halocatena salina]|uniref:Alpha/beta hydrolase n=1 Tax=Halocatena salina TaxID=2934340 RepID=A0A8U0A731_9EURY|nr:alpha/beta fold hydrolase [Halocatena salina]UPM44328.1 alpha/beta hydrolase [Halocatena salina]